MNQLMRFRRPESPAWPNFGRWSELRSEIDRLFGAPLSELAEASQFLSGWSPAMDVNEDKDNVYVRVELPGMKKEDIDVSLHDNALTLSGERRSETKQEESQVYRSERFFGRFQRTVSLPAPVNPEKVKAQYRDGILSVTLAKTEESKPKQIDVKVG